MQPLEALRDCKRPVLAFGAGVRGAEEKARAFAAALGIPVIVTWAARDMFPDAIGGFGTHGVRAANLAVQNCDWLLAIGARLDTKATGTPVKLFAPLAKRWMVDVDPAEIEKFQHLDLEIEGICTTAEEFFSSQKDAVADFELAQSIAAMPAGRMGVDAPDFGAWRWQCKDWKFENPPGAGREPYRIMIELGRHLRPEDTVVSDTGCVLAWAMQALKLPCRFLHAWNQTPMGSGLPMAIGAAFATGKRVILLTGDGGLAVNSIELADVAKHNLPIKILLFNNRGYAMCRQTQRQWLDGRYHGADAVDLATPNFGGIARANGIWCAPSMESALSHDGPAFHEFEIGEDEEVSPQVKFGEALA